MKDLIALDSLLSEEEKAVRSSVRDFITLEFMPLVEDVYEAGEFPRSIIPRLAKMGLLGSTLSESYGGNGVSAVIYGLICQELERGDSGLRSFVSVQSSLCIYPILTFGTEAQKKQYLPDLCQGKLIGCFGLTEPDSGSDPASLQTTAKKVKGGFILNGSKTWITNAPIADIAIVWAKTESGIRGFIVEKEMTGFTVKTIHHKMSLRLSATGQLFFNDCFVPDTHYLSGTDIGIKAPLSCLSQARYGIAWGAMGAAEACFDIALQYAKERCQFNKPIAGFQLIQKDLVDMYNEICKAALFNLQLGRLKDRGQVDANFISLAKMNSSREALTIARKARNLLGANGISLEYHVIRHLMNLETVFTYEGTDNIHHLIVGRYLTGIEAFN